MEKSNNFFQFDQQIFQTVQNANATLLFAYLENKYNLRKRRGELRASDNAFYIKNFEEVNLTIGLGKDALKAALNVLVEANLIKTIYNRSKYGCHYFIIINENTVNTIRQTVNVVDTKEAVKADRQEKTTGLTVPQTKNLQIMKNKKHVEDISIVRDIKKQLKEGKEYTNQQIKEVLNTVCKEHGITNSIPASAITKIASTTKLDTTRNGVKFKGFRIDFYNYVETKKETFDTLGTFSDTFVL